MKNINIIKSKWFYWPLFLLLFTYVIIRAYTLEPMLDEIATIFNYVENDSVFGGSAILDANNHVLISYFAKFINIVFGDHFFGNRLLSIISFIVYFFFSKKLVQTLVVNNYAFLVFLAIITTPWLLDYFSLCRGYGASLGLLMVILCLLNDYFTNSKTKYFLAIVILLMLWLAASLSVLIPALIIFSFCIYHFITSNNTKKNTVGFILISLIFIAYLIPTYIYILKLKKAGALWWGSRAGLWEVTGKSISKLTLFTESGIVKAVLILLITLLVIHVIRRLINGSLRTLLEEPTNRIILLLLFSLISAVLMANFMEVNYPMDRVGMYLVPLIILSVSGVIDKNSQLKHLLLALIWFPITFIYNFNINTTIFSPEDRINNEFNNHVQTITQYKHITGDYVMSLVYAYMNRQEEEQNIMLCVDNNQLTYGDYHLSWQGKMPIKGYELLIKSKTNTNALYRRIQPLKRTLIKDTVIYSKQSNAEVTPLFTLNLARLKGRLQCEIIGENQTTVPNYGLNIIQQYKSVDGSTYKPDNYRFKWYFGSKRSYKYQIHSSQYELKRKDEVLEFYFINPEKSTFLIKNIRIKIYQVQ